MSGIFDDLTNVVDDAVDAVSEVAEMTRAVAIQAFVDCVDPTNEVCPLPEVRQDFNTASFKALLEPAPDLVAKAEPGIKVTTG